MSTIKKIVLLLDGEEPSAAQLRYIVQNADFIIATDGAAGYAQKHGIALGAIIGDMDSISIDTKRYFLSHNTIMIEDPDQTTNDFEKALRYVKEEYPDSSLVILGIHGKRTDHLLVNFSVMLRYASDLNMEAHDMYHKHIFLTDRRHNITIQRPKGTLVTLLAFAPTKGITTSGLLYPLTDGVMEFGKKEGLSNVINSDNGATINIQSGALLVSIAL